MLHADFGFLDEENAVYTVIVDGMKAAAFEDFGRCSEAVDGFGQTDEAEFRFHVHGVLYVWDRSAGEVELTVSSPDIPALHRSLEAFIGEVKARADQAVFRFYFGAHYEREIGRV